MKAPSASIGCRVKTGWASFVLLAGPPDQPRVLDRRVVELSDPEVPESRQPYHAAFGTARTSAGDVERLVRVVEAYARRSVAELIEAYRSAGRTLSAGGIVAGSDIDPARIANQHMRAHAEEGRLYRTVVSDALRRHRLAVSLFLERDLYAVAARRVGKSVQQVKRAAGELGREAGSPWRAEEKGAAVAAWMVLTGAR